MSLIMYIANMGQRPSPVGTVTTYFAGEMRAQQARLDLTLDDIAARSGVPRQTVHSLLKGQRAIPVETLFMLCQGLGLSPAELMQGAMRASAWGCEPNSDKPSTGGDPLARA